MAPSNGSRHVDNRIFLIRHATFFECSLLRVMSFKIDHMLFIYFDLNDVSIIILETLTLWFFINNFSHLR